MSLRQAEPRVAAAVCHHLLPVVPVAAAVCHYLWPAAPVVVAVYQRCLPVARAAEGAFPRQAGPHVAEVAFLHRVAAAVYRREMLDVVVVCRRPRDQICQRCP